MIARGSLSSSIIKQRLQFLGTKKGVSTLFSKTHKNTKCRSLVYEGQSVPGGYRTPDLLKRL